MRIVYESHWEPPTKGYPYHRLNIGTWCAKVHPYTRENGSPAWLVTAGARHERPRRFQNVMDDLSSAMIWAERTLARIHADNEAKRQEIGR